MSDTVPVGNRISNVKVSPRFNSYSKVVLKVSDSEAYVAGDDTGRTLEVSNPWGTQEIANHILARLKGTSNGTMVAYQYAPYDANGAILDPAAEMGDFLNSSAVFGGIFTRKRDFGRLMKANVGSPTDEEINHEYQFESPQRREYTRLFGEVKASILIQAGEIEAKVSKTSPQGQTSFRWSLTDTAHRWYANNSNDPVMEVNATGLIVRGEVNASSGVIGGFTIGVSAIYNGVTAMGDESHTNGVYVGTDGIKLGQNFEVDSSGNVTAKSMALYGTLSFYDQYGELAGTLSADRLRQGAQDGYDWSHGSYQGTTPHDYALGGAGGGYRFNKATNSGSGEYPSFFRSQILRATSTLTVDNSFVLRNSTINKSSMIVLGDGGSTQIIRYLSW